MSTAGPEQPVQTNGSGGEHYQHHSAPEQNSTIVVASDNGNGTGAENSNNASTTTAGGGGSSSGFTAVNGILNRPSASPTSPRSESHQVPTTNGNTAPSIESSRSSPRVNAIHPRRPSSSPESTHSPPIRKRSYNEALGDDHDYSMNHRKDEEYSEERKFAEDESRHSGEHDDEQRLASEALRRESETSRRGSTSLNGDDRSYPEYERTPAGALIDLDRKKRKRVFSNRTKTGCMTCRKRKKKCDEMHPECNNCLRGGFVCEGYSARNTWQKPNATKAPIPLQSKEGPSTYQHTLTQPGSGPASTPVRYSDEYSRPDNHSMDDSRRLSPHRDQQQQQQPQQQQQRPPLYNPGPPQYNNPPPPQLPPPTGPYGDRPIEARPPLPKPEHLDHPEQSYSSIQMPPRGPLPPPPPQHQQHHPHSQQQQQHPQQQHPHPQHPQHQPHQLPPAHHNLHPQHHNNPPPPMQMAPPMSGNTPPQRPVSHHRQETERDKMLRGEYFLPYTPALMADREQCALAVWRFNNSTNPTMGIKMEERMNFFRDIVNLRPVQDAPDGASDPNDPPIVGSVGSGVIVEAPFSCDYGYNISIGNDVVIGADCRITDTCSVHIGNNVVFSPGVRLMCATYAIDPKERKKGKGRALGRQIVIEDDVWIGSNVIILPGVKIGRCTTIGAGSLLHKDVPPGVVVAGNPPKVVRGIYDDGRAS